MFSYQKRLQFPVNIKKKDLRLAKYLVTQYGGSNGELAAALRYLNQRYTMPDNKGKALLTDIGTEELAHVEIIDTMIYQLMKDASLEEIKEAGLDTHYAEHAKALYPTNASGVPFTVSYFATTGDPLADLSEDMAAEQKARAVYENLIDLTTDQDVIDVLLWLRQREIIHFTRFKELFDYYERQGFDGSKYKNEFMNDENESQMNESLIKTLESKNMNTNNAQTNMQSDSILDIQSLLMDNNYLNNFYRF